MQAPRAVPGSYCYQFWGLVSNWLFRCRILKRGPRYEFYVQLIKSLPGLYKLKSPTAGTIVWIFNKSVLLTKYAFAVTARGIVFWILRGMIFQLGPTYDFWIGSNVWLFRVVICAITKYVSVSYSAGNLFLNSTRYDFFDWVQRMTFDSDHRDDTYATNLVMLRKLDVSALRNEKRD